jgi:two-component system, chemotaxis family, CheB/CheR fusion protein
MSEKNPKKARSRSDQPAPAPQVPAEEKPAALADVKADADADAHADAKPEVQATDSFPIVGIGTSAGGLAALEAFFSAMPPDSESGMAMVLVQHLSPDHKSILCELLRRYTRKQVYEAEDGMVVQRNCVYVMPPNCDMALLNGTLHLLKPTLNRGMRLPIDYFFRSLAQDQHERAICIVLSGSGSDGTLGVRAVKGEGGMVMVQDPRSTEYDSMPRSAIATGLVDYVLPVTEMPAQLLSYVTHAFGKLHRAILVPTPKTDDTLKKICILVRAFTGHDFSQYKESTFIRRIGRRMAMQQLERPEEYLRFLQNTPVEVETLFHDLLIGVTNFFRDSEAFTALQAHVLPRMFANKRVGEAVRVWVCGCSTGEEAYSIAILIQEYLETLKQRFKVQVFSTDVDKQILEQARSGIFPASIAADISPERLAKYFFQEAGTGVYRVQKVVRDMLIFSEHDVIKDPPFSKLDLVSCRNLLIYLNVDLQRKLIPLFHFALNPGGSLFLGTSETVGDCSTLFEPLDRKWKIYSRLQTLSGTVRPMLDAFAPPLSDKRARIRAVVRGVPQTDLRTLTEDALLEHLHQAAVLINGRGEILHILGRTGKFLEPASGDATMNILVMAREGLQRRLTTALHRVVAHRTPVYYPGLKVKTNGDFAYVNLTLRLVVDASVANTATDLYMVVLEGVEKTPDSPSPAPAEKSADETALNARIATLEQELQNKEEYLQTTLEEMDTTNEELKSSNEEMQSVNEELQSTNEELETSKEELQSVNEELATVNGELQAKILNLSQLNNDMNNLLASTGIGTLFVDVRLCVSRFTPAITQVINLIQTDIGRPLAHLVSNMVSYERLVEDVQHVFDTLIPIEIEVQTKDGAWHMMRIRPYRTTENTIEGVVLTFLEITNRKRKELILAEGIVAAVREPLVVLDDKLCVVLINLAFCHTFHVAPDEVVGQRLYDLGNHQWDIPELRRLIEEILSKDATFEDFEVNHEFEHLGMRKMLLNVRRILCGFGTRPLILLAIEDVTDKK